MMVALGCSRGLFFGLLLVGSALAALGKPASASCDGIVVDDVWAGTRIRFGSVATDDKAFIAYFDPDRQLSVAEIDLATCEVEIKALPSEFPGFDGHNDIVMAFDGQLRLHVSGNMHADPLVYFRSSEPLDVASLAPAEMIGRDEDSVTYPRFFSSDGRLAFMYRDGRAARGQWFMNLWDGAEWERVTEAPLFSADRDGDVVSAYPSEFELGPDGFYHVSVVWLGDPGFENRFRLSYGKTEDFRTWRSHDGRTLPLPLHPDTMDTVDDVGANRGLFSARLAVADDGTPYITYTKYTPDGLNGAYLATPSGSGWDLELLAESGTLTPLDSKKRRGDLPTVSAVHFEDGEAVMTARFPGEDVIKVRLPEIGVSTERERLPAALRRDPVFADVLPLLQRPTFIASIPDDANGDPVGGLRFVSLAQHRSATRVCKSRPTAAACNPAAAPLVLLSDR